MGDHGHAGQPRGAVDRSGPGGGLRGGRRGLHIGRTSPVERGGAHRERPRIPAGACAADGDVPGERLRVGTAQGTQRPPAGGGGVQRTGGSVRGGHAIGVGDGASVDGVQRLDKEGLEHAYVFFLTPEGHQAIVFRLHANRACTDGGICTADRRRLSNSPLGHDPWSVGRRGGAADGGVRGAAGGA